MVDEDEDESTMPCRLCRVKTWKHVEQQLMTAHHLSGLADICMPSEMGTADHEMCVP